MDSELLLKFIGHFRDYLSALSRTLLRFFFFFFFFGQPLSKQLYTLGCTVYFVCECGIGYQKLVRLE